MAKGLRGGRNEEQKARRWRQEVGAWQGSGESQVAFCRRRKLRRDQFVYWKKRLGELDSGQGAKSIEIVEVPVLTAKAVGSSDTTAGIALVGLGIWRVEVEPGFDEQTLGRVVAVLEAPL